MCARTKQRMPHQGQRLVRKLEFRGVSQNLADGDCDVDLLAGLVHLRALQRDDLQNARVRAVIQMRQCGRMITFRGKRGAAALALFSAE